MIEIQETTTIRHGKSSTYMLDESAQRRFWDKVSVTDVDSCWEWTAGKNNWGYGTFKMGGKYGKDVIASRISYRLGHGEIPAGMQVLHTCDNPGCVNPKHLFLGTHDENMQDKKKKGRAPRTDGNAKLTFEIAEQIRADTRPYRILSAVYGVSPSVISYIKNDKIWKRSERM